MKPLPNDSKGRFWAVSQACGPKKAEGNALVTLMSSDGEGRIEVLGTAFVIYGHKNRAICVGASHSFDGPKRRKLNRSGYNYLYMPPDFIPKRPVIFSTDEVFALVVRDGDPFTCNIVGFNSIEDYDVATFGLVEPEGRDVFKWKIALNLAVPHVGDEVAALVNHLEIDQLEPGAGKLKQVFHLRRGVVTEVSWDREGTGRLGGQRHIVRTTIPMCGGMSGSPLLWSRGKGTPATVWGVVSSDRSDQEAKENFHCPGDSTASMLWPAMGLFLPVTVEGETRNRYMLLGELLKMGAFDNRSSEASVEVRGSAEKIEIWYSDTRDQPPSRYLLTTTGHQFLSSSSCV